MTKRKSKMLTSTNSKTGNVCKVCGGLVIQTGSCTTCTQCGETSGCG